MYRSVSSSTRLPVSILIPECRDIQDQFWPLKLQKKIGEWNWFNREYCSKLFAGKKKTLQLNPTTNLGGDNVKQSFLSTETTQWQYTAHLFTWEEKERQLKCSEVTCPRMDRNTKVTIYTHTSPQSKVSGFVTRQKALIIIHPHSGRPCIAGLTFQQNSLSYEGNLPSVTASTSFCVTAGGS